MIKIAIIGSSVSSALFNSEFASEYKQIYECVCSVWQSSIISFLSPPLELTNNDLVTYKKVNDKDMNSLLADLSKNYRKEMVASSPDYILVDFYADVKYGVVNKGNSYVTNNPNAFRKTKYSMERKYDRNLNYFLNTKEYTSLLRDSFYELTKWVDKNVPNTKIIINCFQYSYSYLDDSLEHKLFDPRQYHYLDKQNKAYNSIYEYLKKTYNKEISFIDNRNRNYVANKYHSNVVKPWYYEKQYYLDLFNSLNQIVLKDQLSSK